MFRYSSNVRRMAVRYPSFGIGMEMDTHSRCYNSIPQGIEPSLSDEEIREHLEIVTKEIRRQKMQDKNE